MSTSADARINSGICFGHQIVALAMGGACVRNTRFEVSATKLQLTELGKRIYGVDSGVLVWVPCVQLSSYSYFHLQEHSFDEPRPRSHQAAIIPYSFFICPVTDSWDGPLFPVRALGGNTAPEFPPHWYSYSHQPRPPRVHGVHNADAPHYAPRTPRHWYFPWWWASRRQPEWWSCNHWKGNMGCYGGRMTNFTRSLCGIWRNWICRDSSAEFWIFRKDIYSHKTLGARILHVRTSA